MAKRRNKKSVWKTVLKTFAITVSVACMAILAVMAIKTPEVFQTTLNTFIK